MSYRDLCLFVYRAVDDFEDIATTSATEVALPVDKNSVSLHWISYLLAPIWVFK
jgi:hypothetical protein